MSKQWEKLFEQEPFDFTIRDLGSLLRLQDRRLTIGLRTQSAQTVWTITVAEGELAAQPELKPSSLLGVPQLPLYTRQEGEQAIVWALNDDCCLMLSDPAERFAESCQFPQFFSAAGTEVAYHALMSGVGQGWGLTMLAEDMSRPRACLAVLGGTRGCILLKMMAAT